MTISGPIPADDVPSWRAVEAEVAEVLGSLNASTARVVDVITRCIDGGWWVTDETHSPEHWVAVRFGFDPARCRRLVRIARALGSWPAVGESFARGQLNETAVDVICAECSPAFDGQLAELAPVINHGQLRRAVVAYRKEPETAADGSGCDPEADPTPAPAPDVVAGGFSHDGRWRGRVDVEGTRGALFESALQAARRALFAERTGVDPDRVEGAALHLITWADALERLSLAGLDALDGATRAGSRPSDRYQALIHVDADHPERSSIHLGPTLSAAQRRELLCDCDLRTILERDGVPVGKGRRQRVADATLRALVEDRDRGCRSCGRGGFVHVHHLVHWEDGGPTEPDNLCALCTGCHRLVHRGVLRISGDPSKPDGLLFVDRTGRPRPGPRPAEGASPPAGALPQHLIRERLVGRWL